MHTNKIQNWQVGKFDDSEDGDEASGAEAGAQAADAAAHQEVAHRSGVWAEQPVLPDRKSVV